MKKLSSAFVYVSLAFGAFMLGIFLFIFIGNAIWGTDNYGTLVCPGWYTMGMIVLSLLLGVLAVKENKKGQSFRRQKESTAPVQKEKIVPFQNIYKFAENYVEQRTEEHYSEKEAFFRETEEKLRKRLEKSREYRIALRDYSEKLGERERELDARKKAATNELEIKRREVDQRIDSMREYENALRKTELTILDWVKRSERKDSEFLAEIQADSEKLKIYQTEMNGYQFEEYVATLMKKNGFQHVEVTKKSQDFGADVVGEKDGIKYVVQCKYYSSMVGIEAVQQVYSSKQHYGAHIAVVATNNVFTKAAKTLAAELKVLLWDCEHIDKMK